MSIESDLPLISCICITYNRPEMLLKSILSFEQQNYQKKELVISYPTKDTITKNLIKVIIQFNQIDILSIERKDDLSIGQSRNDAIEKCSGEYVCIWDDDDLYHYTRISEQYKSIQNHTEQYKACILTRILLYSSYNQTAYLSLPYFWVCTLLCKKEYFLQYTCSDTNQLECTPIVNMLSSMGLAYYIDNNPSLYTYIFHGTNVMLYKSFLYIVNRSHIVHLEVSQSIRSYFEQDLSK